MSEISSEKEPLRAKSPLRLLQVEHEQDDVELCLRELKKSGLQFEVDTVATREIYVQKLTEKPFDVVIADYRLPGWTGMDALAEIKQRDLNIPLILVTGTLGDRLAVECIKEGITDYVLKDQLARLPAALIRAREEKELRDAETRAIDALRASEARYRGLVQNATYGMLWVTGDGNLLAVNPAFVRMLGYNSAEELLAIGNTTALYRDPSVPTKLRQKYKASGSIEATAEWKRKDDKIITVRLSGRRVIDPEQNGECAEVIVEDVTERLALEKQLLQAQKFEAIGQLAGGIAHDFNNMIGAIMGWSDIGMEETEEGARLRRHFQKIHQQAERAAALTRQLLAFARRQILRAAQYRPESERHRNSQPPRKSNRQQYRNQDHPRSSSLSGSRRSYPSRTGSDEPLHQRPRCHARRWLLAHRDRARHLRCGILCSPTVRAPRRLCDAFCHRHGNGDGRDHRRPHFRTVLHHQGARQGHRSRTRHGIRHR